MKIANFTPNTIVRDINDAHPYLVIQRLTHAILVVDAEAKDKVNNIKVILERDFDQYVNDLDFKCKQKRMDDDIVISWERGMSV